MRSKLLTFLLIAKHYRPILRGVIVKIPIHVILYLGALRIRYVIKIPHNKAYHKVKLARYCCGTDVFLLCVVEEQGIFVIGCAEDSGTNFSNGIMVAFGCVTKLKKR